jgi:hypothetical protein
MWTGFIWLSSKLLLFHNGLNGFPKTWGIFSLNYRLLASRGLSTIELVTLLWFWCSTGQGLRNRLQKFRQSYGIFVDVKWRYVVRTFVHLYRELGAWMFVHTSSDVLWIYRLCMHRFCWSRWPRGLRHELSFVRSNTGVVGSNTTQGIEFICVYSMFVLSCVCR